MMCYDSKSGAFDFTYEEFETFLYLCQSQIDSMTEENEIYDPHKFLYLNQLSGKIDGILNFNEI